MYGRVVVSGLTLEEAKQAIQDHLSEKFLEPKISISVTACNSRAYYIIFEMDGKASQVFRLPVTGNERILDAVAEAHKLFSTNIDHKRIRLARRASADGSCCQERVYAINWKRIARGAK